jgi:hypothetical protein
MLLTIDGPRETLICSVTAGSGSCMNETSIRLSALWPPNSSSQASSASTELCGNPGFAISSNLCEILTISYPCLTKLRDSADTKSVIH